MHALGFKKVELLNAGLAAGGCVAPCTGGQRKQARFINSLLHQYLGVMICPDL